MPETPGDRILQFHGRENVSNQGKLHVLRRATMHPDTKKPFSRKDSDEVMRAIIMYEHLAKYESIERVSKTCFLHLVSTSDIYSSGLDVMGFS